MCSVFFLVNILVYSYNVDIVVTKESGIAGGFLEKVNACETLQIPVVIITREKINYPLVVNEIDELEKLL